MRDEPVRLTYVEFEVLAALARNPGRVFSRTMLLERVWGDSSYRDPRTVDVHIRHLREKLEPEPKHPELILTVRGVGYRFQDHEPASATALGAHEAGAGLLRDHAAAFAVLYFFVDAAARVEARAAQLDDIAASRGTCALQLEALIGATTCSRSSSTSACARSPSHRRARDAAGRRSTKRELRFFRSPTRAEKAAPSQRGSLRAARSARARAETSRHVRRQGGRPGGPAVLRPRGSDAVAVALYSRDLDDVAEAVDLVRNRVLSPPASRCCWRWSAATWWRRRSRGACGGSSWPPTRSPTGASSTRCRSTPRTSSAS